MILWLCDTVILWFFEVVQNTYFLIYLQKILLDPSKIIFFFRDFKSTLRSIFNQIQEKQNIKKEQGTV